MPALDGRDTRYMVCGAVSEITHLELPSMAGYGLDTYTTCTICGSSRSSTPIFGCRPHPQPWPPHPDQADTPPGQAVRW